MRSPSAATLPSSGTVRPAIMSRSVDLPHPLGPTRHTKSPARVRSVTPSSACTVVARVRNHFDTPSTASAPVPVGGCCTLRRLQQASEVRGVPEEASLLRLGHETLKGQTVHVGGYN